jgi:polysaccharide biosynthesis/export protein
VRVVQRVPVKEQGTGMMMVFRMSTPLGVVALTLQMVITPASPALAQGAQPTQPTQSTQPAQPTQPARPAQSAPPPVASPAPPAAPGAAAKTAVAGEVIPPAGYLIGPDDVLAVVFWREKDLSVDAIAVRPDGMITVPLINDIKAAGMTPDQVRERIQTAASKYVADPSVTVVVKAINSRKVFITGQIAKPGQYPLTGPTSVMQLIAMAGGLHEFADGENILIMRTEAGQQVAKPFNYDDVLDRKNLQQNIELLPGDTILVP